VNLDTAQQWPPLRPAYQSLCQMLSSRREKLHGQSQKTHTPAFIEYLRRRLGRRELPDPTWLQPEMTVSDDYYLEGQRMERMVSFFQRSRAAREACLKHYGPGCQVCGFDFGATYGPMAQGYIHIHHRTPLADIGETYLVHAIEDLVPVCANCHVALHLKTETGGFLTVEELQGRLLAGRNALPQ
jgi:5-methylcytosine-specific restriction endonuclease McrA